MTESKSGSVAAVALYDRVSYKPQEALDAADMQGKRLTSYFDKGEVVDLPASEFKRLTTGPFALEPAVRKAGKDESPASAAAPPEAPPEPTANLGEGPGASAAQAKSGTPLEPHAVPGGPTGEPTAPGATDAASLEAMTVKDLTRLARDNQVPISARDRKTDLVAKLSAANVAAR